MTADPLVVQYATKQDVADSGGGGGGGAIVGEIRLLPFRVADLPDGWHFPSGQYYELASPIGAVLNSLPANFKSDWGITVSGSTIRLCDNTKFFSGAMGRFFRPVNGSDRLPGSVENDATRNATGDYSPTASVGVVDNNSPVTGVFYVASDKYKVNMNLNSQSKPSYHLGFDLSLSVGAAAIADEVRPYNVGMTPAIYLGV